MDKLFCTNHMLTCKLYVFWLGAVQSFAISQVWGFKMFVSDHLLFRGPPPMPMSDTAWRIWNFISWVGCTQTPQKTYWKAVHDFWFWGNSLIDLKYILLLKHSYYFLYSCLHYVHTSDSTSKRLPRPQENKHCPNEHVRVYEKEPSTMWCWTAKLVQEPWSRAVFVFLFFFILRRMGKNKA